MSKVLIQLITGAIVSFVIFFSCSNAEISDSTTEEQKWKDVTVDDGNSLLWKIEGNGCVPSYMYGTMHLIEEEYYNFTDPMAERVMGSDAIIMEVGGMPDPFAALEMMTLDSGNVADYFTKEQMTELLAFMDSEMGVTTEMFHKMYGGMKPFFIMQNITQLNFEGPTESYDLTIMQLAGENEIPLIGFETFEQQLGFFDAVSQEDMASMIMESIQDPKGQRKEMKKLMKLYSKQKVDKFIPLMTKQSPEFMQFADLFLYDRNKAWIPTLKKEISDKQCFVAVGAAHLFGEGGVIDLMEKEGYTITPISTDF